MNKFQNDPNFAKVLQLLARIEPILLALVLFGFVSVVQAWPVPPQVFIVATTTLVTIYFLRSLALVVAVEEIFERFARRLIYWALCVGLLAFLFQVMGWPGWMDMAMSAITGILVCFAIFTFRKTSILNVLNMYELCSLLLVMLYLGKTFYQMNS